MIRIEPVPFRRRRHALAVVLDAHLLGDDARAVKAFCSHARRLGRWRGMWWAMDDREPMAAAAVLDLPGRTGWLFHSSPSPVQQPVLAELICRACQCALGRGLSLVQRLVAPEDSASLEICRQGGMSPLADLVYMRRRLSADEAVVDCRPGGPDLTWRDCRRGLRGLRELVLATYEGSRDCPALLGRRRVEDIIEGHRRSGRYRAGSWWIASIAGRDAGCVLVNDSTEGAGSEVVYLGVAAAYRGLGVGGSLMARAVSQAASRGRSQLTLAVDAGNAAAVRLYERWGLRPWQRRTAMVALVAPIVATT